MNKAIFALVTALSASYGFVLGISENREGMLIATVFGFLIFVLFWLIYKKKKP